MFPRELMPAADLTAISSLREERSLWLQRESVQKYKDAIDSLSDLHTTDFDFNTDAVRIGKKEELKPGQEKLLLHALRTCMPWRKGPFEVFGNYIDAEWQSNRKWERILSCMPSLKDKVVADVGCNNGYYMYRMLDHAPKHVLGIDPMVPCYYSFQLLQSLIAKQPLSFELFGVEHMQFFKDVFDVVFLMGIIYHHRSPVDLLKNIRTSMKKDGYLIVETQGIPGDDPVALFPAKRYAKVPGTYFVPTVSCMENFLHRAGFKEVNTFFSHPMSSEEQRRTDWMVFESYANFIDQEDSSRTIEGYPAPIRIYTICRNQ